MAPHFRFSLLFVALYVIVKMLLFNINKHDEWYLAIIFTNILFLLLAVFFTVRVVYKGKQPTAITYLDIVKTALKPGMLYAILLSGFIYLYYAKIDSGFTQKRIAETTQRAAQFYDAEKIKNTDKELLKLSKDEYVLKASQSAQFIYSPFVASTLGMIGLVFMSLLYAIIIAWAWKAYLYKL
jgi:hypothetical protein